MLHVTHSGNVYFEINGNKYLNISDFEFHVGYQVDFFGYIFEYTNNEQLFIRYGHMNKKSLRKLCTYKVEKNYILIKKLHDTLLYDVNNVLLPKVFLDKINYMSMFEKQFVLNLEDILLKNSIDLSKYGFLNDDMNRTKTIEFFSNLQNPLIIFDIQNAFNSVDIESAKKTIIKFTENFTIENQFRHINGEVIKMSDLIECLFRYLSLIKLCVPDSIDEKEYILTEFMQKKRLYTNVQISFFIFKLYVYIIIEKVLKQIYMDNNTVIQIYVDDFIVVSNNSTICEFYKNQIALCLQEHGLVLNTKKTNLINCVNSLRKYTFLKIPLSCCFKTLYSNYKKMNVDVYKYTKCSKDFFMKMANISYLEEKNALICTANDNTVYEIKISQYPVNNKNLLEMYSIYMNICLIDKLKRMQLDICK